MKATIDRDTTRLLNVSVERITPDKASFYLASNVRNRPMNQFTVNQLANAMKRGEWKVTHQGIAFDTNNHLIDGQHRLKAIIVADVAVEMTIHRDADPETFDVIDVGRKRKFGDLLALNGEQTATLLAAAVAWKWRYDNNGVNSGRIHPTTIELEQTLKDNPFLREHVNICNELEPRMLIAPSLATWLSYEFACVDPSASAKFFEGVGRGLNLEEGNAIIALRSRLFDNITAQRGGRIGPRYVSAWVIKAWNAWYTRRPLLRISYGESEKFPEIVKSIVPTKRADEE